LEQTLVWARAPTPNRAANWGKYGRRRMGAMRAEPGFAAVRAFPGQFNEESLAVVLYVHLELAPPSNLLRGL